MLKKWIPVAGFEGVYEINLVEMMIRSLDRKVVNSEYGFELELNGKMLKAKDGVFTLCLDGYRKRASYFTVLKWCKEKYAEDEVYKSLCTEGEVVEHHINKMDKRSSLQAEPLPKVKKGSTFNIEPMGSSYNNGYCINTSTVSVKPYR